MGKLDTVEVNGPEGDVVDWDAVDWRAVEDDVRRLRHRIFTEGLLEPGASKRRTPGSEGAAAQQCAAATRLEGRLLPVGVRGVRPLLGHSLSEWIAYLEVALRHASMFGPPSTV